MTEHQKNLAIGFAILALPVALIVALFVKYSGPKDPIHQVYQRCRDDIPDFAMADATLAAQAQRECRRQQQIAYLSRDIDKRQAATR